MPRGRGARASTSTAEEPEQEQQEEEELRFAEVWLRFVAHQSGLGKIKRIFAYSGHLLQYYKRKGLKD